MGVEACHSRAFTCTQNPCGDHRLHAPRLFRNPSQEGSRKASADFFDQNLK
jgi:hypothetical protein